MNDPFLPFTKPTPQVPPWRQGLRVVSRRALLGARQLAWGRGIKFWNSHLNWREFWHGRTHLDSFPRQIQVGTNWTCNLRCSFCRLTMDWTRQQLAQLPPAQLQLSERVEGVVRELLPFAEMVVLTPLGEPLMWSGLPGLLEHHAQAGSRNLALTTNGMLLTEKNCERLVRGQLRQLFVSVDSNDPQIYAQMRVGGYLQQVEQGITRLVRTKQKFATPFPTLTLNATFMERNIRQLPSMVTWARQLGFDEISVQLMEIENPEQETEFLGHHVDLTRQCVTQALELGRQVGLVVRPHLAIRNLISAASQGHDVVHGHYEAASPLMPQASRTESAGAPESQAGSFQVEGMLDMRSKTLVEKCHYPWYNLLIDTDGDVRSCCWIGASLGNLNELSFQDVWNGSKVVALRRSFLANTVPLSCQKKHCRVDL